MIENLANSNRWTEIYAFKFLFAMIGVFAFMIPLVMAHSFELISQPTFFTLKGFIVGVGLTLYIPSIYLLDKDRQRQSELVEKGKQYEAQHE